MSRRSEKQQVIGICVLLVILVVLVFGQVVGHGFINYDDDHYVYENPIVLKGLSLEGISWAFGYGEIGHWHPLTWMSHMLDCEFFGMRAGGHHLSNVVFHAMAAVLLFLTLFRMTGNVWRCAFIAAAWAIHPLRVESVAWISERKDVLAGLFFMLTVGAYVRYVRQPSTRRYIIALVLFTLGLLSKNMLVTLPCVLLLLDYWPLGRLTQSSQFPRLFKEKIPFFALSVVSCAITFLVPEQVALADRLPLWFRIQNAFVSCGTYLRQTFWPSGLAVHYPNPSHPFSFWEVAGWFSLLCFLSVGTFRWRKSYPCLLVGWLWFIGMLVPVIGLVQISTYSHADRYTYLPQIGLGLAGTWLVADWVGKWRHRRLLGGSMAGLGVCILSITAFQQTSYWRDSKTLWTHTLGCIRDNRFAHNNLGNVLLQQGKTEDAIAHYREALRIDPAYAQAHVNLGNALFQQGKTEEAITQHREALQIDPRFAEAHYNLGIAFLQTGRGSDAVSHFQKALELEPNFAKAEYNLGMAFLQIAQVNEAVVHYKKALEINPDYADAEYNLGIALAQLGRISEAVSHYKKVLTINPNYAAAHNNLGTACIQLDRVGDALAHFQTAITLNPSNAEALNNMALVLATTPNPTMRNGRKAVELAERADHLTGNRSASIGATLSVAYAEAGRSSDAVKAAQRACQLASDQGNTALADALRAQIRLYQSGSP